MRISDWSFRRVLFRSQHNADLDRVVIVMGKPLFGRVRRVVAGEDDEDRPDAERENDETMDSERIAGGRRKERQPTKGDRGADDDGELPLSPRKDRKSTRLNSSH